MIRRGGYFFLGLLGFQFFFVFVQRVVVDQVGIKNKRKQMSDDDSSVTLHSESEMSEDSESEGSLADFVVDDDDEPEVCFSCHTEICVANILTKKRRRTEVVPDDHDSSCNESDSDDDSDYSPSEPGLSSEDETSCDESD